MKGSMRVIAAAMLALATLSAIASDDPPGDGVLAIGDIRRGEFVTVVGQVTRVRGYDEFLLADETGRARVYVRGGFRRALISGEQVEVSGWVDDDLLAFAREIYATEIVLADGTVMEVRGGYDR